LNTFYLIVKLNCQNFFLYKIENEEINKLIELTKEFAFMNLSTNSNETRFEICKNSQLKLYKSEENIYESSEKKVENFLLISGSANIYKKREKVKSNSVDFNKDC